MNIRIIDTSDCISDIRSTVEERRLIHLLSMSRWVVLVSLVFGALCAVLADLQLKNWLVLGWYVYLAVVSVLLWLLTCRPKTSIVNLDLQHLQKRFLFCASALALSWVCYSWYLGLFLKVGPTHLFIVTQIQVFYLINCTFFFLNSRAVAYGFFLLTMVSPIVLFITLFLLSIGSHVKEPSGLLRLTDYYWLMALLQALYTVVFFFSIRRMAGELATTVRLRTLYEISNSRLMRINKELESESNTDYLTGVANRRSYETGVQREWSRCVRSGSLFTLFVLDIDYFKLFNDRYGHLAGDRALKTVAEVLSETLRRPGDLVARYGGEEFAVVVTGTPLSDCQSLADQVREAVRDLGLQNEDSTVDDSLTVSIGLAQCQPEATVKPSSLFNRADAALYSAKQQGRNRVVTYDDSLSHCLEEAEQERRRKSKRNLRAKKSSLASAAAPTPVATPTVENRAVDRPASAPEAPVLPSAATPAPTTPAPATLTSATLTSAVLAGQPGAVNDLTEKNNNE